MSPTAISRNSITFSFSLYACFFQVSLSITSAHQNPVCTYSVPCTSYMSCPSHSFLSDHSNKYLVKNREHKVSRYIGLVTALLPLPFRPKYLPHDPILEHPEPMFLAQYEIPISTPIRKTDKIIILCILIYMFGYCPQIKNCFYYVSFSVPYHIHAYCGFQQPL
jgi:hypothetical protein